MQDASRQSLVETLNRFLLSLAGLGASALAVVDIAQNLRQPVLEQLRPIEMALPEFLMAGIFRQADTRALGGAAHDPG